MYIKIILFCLLTSCVSIKTYEKALEKINILELENNACTADATEFQTLMMKLNKSIHSEALCKRRFKACNQRLQNKKETFYD
tara:strand:- start:13 stop:258 length:246 start_codon:yes stop_codon:yes gene_type:complete